MWEVNQLEGIGLCLLFQTGFAHLLGSVGFAFTTHWRVLTADSIITFWQQQDYSPDMKSYDDDR